jgi:DNA-binding Lrp family transcriptional regulator
VHQKANWCTENFAGWIERFGNKNTFLFPMPTTKSQASNPTSISQVQVERMPTAFILLNTEIGAEREVLEKLRATDGVQEAYSLLGIYDIIARIKTDTPEKLTKVLNEKFDIGKVHSKLTIIASEN